MACVTLDSRSVVHTTPGRCSRNRASCDRPRSPA